MKDDDFKLLRGFVTDGQTNERTDGRTFVNVESLSRLKSNEPNHLIIIIIRVNYCLNRLYLSTVCSQLDNLLNAMYFSDTKRNMHDLPYTLYRVDSTLFIWTQFIVSVST